MKYKDPLAMRAARHGIAQQRLEGLIVPRSVIRDMNLVARGKIDIDDAIENFHYLVASGQVLSQLIIILIRKRVSLKIFWA